MKIIVLFVGLKKIQYLLFKMTEYKCSTCKFSTDSKCNIKVHVRDRFKCIGSEILIKIVHQECSRCHKIFDDNTGFQQHLKRARCTPEKRAIFETDTKKRAWNREYYMHYRFSEAYQRKRDKVKFRSKYKKIYKCVMLELLKRCRRL